MKYAILTKECPESQRITTTLRQQINLIYDEITPDLLIIVGGDGTILKGVHKYLHILEKIIVIGIHTGHLGFYANFKTSNLEQVIKAINNQQFLTYQYPLLNYHLETTTKTITGYALNEITIINPPNVLELDVLITEEHFETFRGTGLCIATPSGSTAYNKSLGGAIVDPKLASIQLTEIASINSNAYRTIGSSIVLCATRTITLKPPKQQDIVLTVDHQNYQIKSLLKITVKLSTKKVTFAYLNQLTFFETLKKAFL